MIFTEKTQLVYPTGQVPGPQLLDSLHPSFFCGHPPSKPTTIAGGVRQFGSLVTNHDAQRHSLFGVLVHFGASVDLGGESEILRMSRVMARRGHFNEFWCTRGRGRVRELLWHVWFFWVCPGAKKVYRISGMLWPKGFDIKE